MYYVLIYSHILFINNFQLQYIIIKQQMDLEYSKYEQRAASKLQLVKCDPYRAYYALYKNNKINTNGCCCVYIYNYWSKPS